MTQQYHEGQEVKVRLCEADPIRHGFHVRWRKAKIVRLHAPSHAYPNGSYSVQFPEPNGKYDVDGIRAVFDAAHIREQPDEEAEIFRVGDPHP